MTLRVPDELAAAAERVARETDTSLSLILTAALAYWLGRADGHDEIAALHARINQLETRLPRR